MLTSFANGQLIGARYGQATSWVLALHGWARTHTDFDQILCSGSSDNEIDAIALDLPGFGAAQEPTGPWGSLDYAHLVAGVLDEMGEDVVVVGHSFGGRVAVQLAVEHPDRVSALVLTSAPVCSAPRQARTAPRLAHRYRLIRSLARAHVLSPQRLEDARVRFGSRDYAAASGVMRQVLVRVVNEIYDSEMSSISCPIELLWGEEDRDVPPEVAQAVLAQIPKTVQSSLILCPGVGHLTPLEAPNELRAAILRHKPRARPS